MLTISRDYHFNQSILVEKSRNEDCNRIKREIFTEINSIELKRIC